MKKINKEKISKIIELAENLIGTPYIYGAKNYNETKTFDCSSFVQYLFDSVEIKIPRCTINQVNEGKDVELKNIEEGDLVFLRGNEGRYNEKYPGGIGHIVLYVGEGKVIHASGRMKKVAKENLNEVLERGKFRCVKRILN